KGGTLWGWGDNSQDQLGRSDVVESASPVRVPLTGIVTTVAAGAFSVYSIRADATALAWGDNSFGQLGTGAAGSAVLLAPQELRKLHRVLAIVAGSADAYALEANGTVWAFGDNSLGQLGQDGAEGEPRPRASAVPLRVPGLDGVVQIAAGGDTCYALSKDGSVWAWGDDEFGELGNGTRRLYEARPERVEGLATVASVAAGASSGYALLRDGTVWAWGRGTDRELGDGRMSDESFPVRVGRLSGVTQLTANGEEAFAVDNHGTLWSWGNNGYGQLGDGSVTATDVPVRVAGL
ncbi:MAG TPA: hypothetical protein VED59_08925, partial [Acidimicrobiales bacterium]|nr:hypothetical protein [Acidimicrobiales bacterium]